MDLRRGWALRTGVVALGGCLAMSACGSGASPYPPDSAATTSPAPALDSPLAPYMLSWRELTIVEHARGVMIRDCLAAAGISFATPSLESALNRASAQEATDLARMFGITDSSVAAANGYWPADSAAAGPTPTPSDELNECVEFTDRQLGRDPKRSPYGLARDLLIASRVRLEATPAARAPIGEWVACMDEAGFDVTSPTNDEDDIRFELRARQSRELNGELGPSPRELALAAADIDCKKRTGLVERLQRIATQRELRITRRHRTELVADRRRLDRLVATAQRVVVPTCPGGHSPSSSGARPVSSACSDRPVEGNGS